MNLELLNRRLNEDFDSASVQRGKGYFNQDRVLKLTRDFENGGALIEATVRGSGSGSGSKQYTVAVYVDHRMIDAECSCPVYTQCKHAVAACLTAEKRGLLEDLNHISNGTDSGRGGLTNWLGTLKADATLWSKEQIAYTDKEVLLYVLAEDEFGLYFEIKESKLTKKGVLTNRRVLTAGNIHQRINSYHYKEEIDATALESLAPDWDDNTKKFYLTHRTNASVFYELIQTGRCFWQSTDISCFVNTKPHNLELSWTIGDKYELETNIVDDGDNRLIFSSVPYLLNLTQGTCRLIISPLRLDYLKHLLALPALSADEALEFTQWAVELKQFMPMPIEEKSVLEERTLQPVLNLIVDEGSCEATLLLTYGLYELPYQRITDQELFFQRDGEIRKVVRDEKAEQAALTQLENVGLQLRYVMIQQLYGAGRYVEYSEANNFGISSAELSPDYDDEFFWLNFDNKVRPVLEQQGWLIRQTAVLPKLIDIDSVHGTVSDEFDGWFELGLEVDIDGEKINLVQALLSVLPSLGEWELMGEHVVIPHGSDFIKIKTDHLKPVLRILQQLTDDKQRLPKHHISVLNDLPFVDKWSGDKKLRALATDLKNFSGIKPRTLPKGLKAELRDYQQTGYDWLGFLHDYGFGGILADDMGLGKTVQTLTHVLALKQKGKLVHPAMVICPTSLVHNWKNEAEKFTPTLKVLVLHGSNRFEHFSSMKDHDLVITTYPLIVRDIEQLKKQPISTLILDEAQAIKNAKTKMAKLVRTINAEHRICLSGTPLENHLGELWAQFDFLMPGYLGNQKQFKEYYQKPIEAGERDTQVWLNKRISPFMLRRTKDEVATELPEKTVIIQSISLPANQRKLYESIRSTMEKKVRDLLKEKGLAKSHIEFLDALLKLRQACCHTQLVSLDEAKTINASAKLDFLLDVLPELIEEGRRVLIFSQFAKMLGIIETALNEKGIVTSKLTGQTRKREEVIDKFKSGEASVFLISLKAGGTGLNLTEADTVIHFDPWWNPAAEQQATDRAHRIGQDKPVFVYKLVAENSIEEKVLELQSKKQAMASAIYKVSSEAPLSKLDGPQMLELFSKI